MADAGLNNKVRFHSLNIRLWLRNRIILKHFIILIFKAEQKKLKELNFIFCSDRYLLKINREYLNHDDYTDIISFDLSIQPSKIEGEIYISIERVKENATIFNNSKTTELHRVIFHGILHLCGYKDKSPSEQQAIRAKEDYYLYKYTKYLSRQLRST